MSRSKSIFALSLMALAFVACEGNKTIDAILGDITFSHTPGVDPCPQPVGTFSLRNDGHPASANVSAELDINVAVIDLDGSDPSESPVEFTFVGGDEVEVDVEFNCERAADVAGTLTLRGPNGSVVGTSEITGTVDVDSPATQSDPESDFEGDSTLDIIGVDTGTTLLGQPWVHVRTAGGWKPSDSFYSWFCEVMLFDSDNVLLGDLITQRHDGVAEDIVTGVASSSVEVVHLDDGPVFFVRDEILTIDHLTVTTGMVESPGGVFVSDGVALDTVGNLVSDPQRP